MTTDGSRKAVSYSWVGEERAAEVMLNNSLVFAVCEEAAGLIPKKKRRRRKAHKVGRVHYPTRT